MTTEQQILAALVRPLKWQDGRAETPFGQLSISILSDRAARGGFEYRAGNYVQAAQTDEEDDYRARIAAVLDLGKLVALVEAGQTYTSSHAFHQHQCAKSPHVDHCTCGLDRFRAALTDLGAAP